MLLELLKQLPSCADFKNYINVGMVIKKAIHFDDITMIQITLNFKLPYKLLNNFFFFDKFFFNDFQSKDKVCFFLPS